MKAAPAREFRSPSPERWPSLEGEESCEEESEESGSDAKVDEPARDLTFRKRAEPPPPRAEPKEPKRPEPPRKIGPTADPRSKDLMGDYRMRSRQIYESLKSMGVRMTITGLAEEEGLINETRFHHYSHPRNAATGLRYARLMQRYMAMEDDARADGEDYFSARRIGIFVEMLIGSGGGSRTPQAFLYTLEFFSVLFGFVYDKVDFKRWKRLADDHAKSAPPPVQAPMLDVKMLEYLEEKVLQRSRPLCERVTAAKLRICAQASIRHSDLRSTLLRDLQWCREKGATSALGIRARAPTTKTGPRPWVAAFLGVRPEHDAWLVTAMDLLLTSHGSGWESHDFTGCAPSSGDTFSAYPAALATDVDIIKRMLLNDMAAGVPVPLDKREILSLRWHGAKSTLPTLMTHFGIQARVIQHQGAWKKTSETMLDLYLREGQVLVLTAQIQVLDMVRKGVAISVLEGAALDGRPCRVECDATQFRGRVGWKIPEGRAAGVPAEDLARAMERCGVYEGGRMGAPLTRAARRETEELAEIFRDDTLKGSEEILRESLQVEKDFPPNDLSNGVSSTEASSSTSEDTEDLPLTEDPSLEDDELYGFLVVLPGRRGRVHKPWPGSSGLEEAKPKCGTTSKHFEVLKVGEAWDPAYQLCRKCFGEPRGCEALCGYSAMQGDYLVLCGRRCGLSPAKGARCSELGHRCDLHLEDR